MRKFQLNSLPLTLRLQSNNLLSIKIKKLIPKHLQLQNLTSQTKLNLWSIKKFNHQPQMTKRNLSLQFCKKLRLIQKHKLKPKLKKIHQKDRI